MDSSRSRRSKLHPHVDLPSFWMGKTFGLNLLLFIDLYILFFFFFLNHSVVFFSTFLLSVEIFILK